MKKILNVFLLISVLLFTLGNFAVAETKDENLLINDDRIFALGNKYTSLISLMYEEETARIGLSGYHYNISRRDVQSEIAKTKALTSLLETLNNIRPDSLSAYARADYYTLKELVGMKYFNTKVRNQFELDPLWYLEPIDTIYELLIKNFLPEQERLSYALRRLEAMPELLQEAQENLTNPPDLTLRLAIEKIDRQTANMQGFTALVTRISNDKTTKKQISQLIKQMQNALNKYKTFLQNKLKEEKGADFRIGDEDYEYLFQEVYMLPNRYSKLEGTLENNLKQAEKALVQWITPRVATDLKEEEQEERTVKGKLQAYPKDYYLLAAKYKNAPEYDKVLKTYSDEVKKADLFFVTKKLFPTLSLPIVITSAPPIFRAVPSKVIVYPPVPLAERQSGDVLVTLPKKLNLNKEEFKLNYNYGKIKYNAAEFITPGQTLIYSAEPANLSLLYKLSNDIFYIHGWVKYALDTANENGFFAKEEDKLNYLWNNYKKAVYALADYKLQTKDLDLNSALDYAKDAGIEEQEAKTYLDYLAVRPFDAVSYIIGAQEFQRLRTKYKKKLGKEFDLLTFHNKVLSVGRIPLVALEDSLEKAYAKKEVDSYFSMTYF